jgi:hypothetical protein
MGTATQANPIPDLMYDWISVLKSKGEGLNAYEKYIQDAEREGATNCVEMFRRLYEQDAKQVEEIKGHLKEVFEHFKV